MQQFIVILRWVFLLPAALLCAWLGYYIMALAWNISLSMQGIDLTSLFVRICHEAASGGAMGAALVFGGTYVAPTPVPLILPEILEPFRRELGVAHGVHDVLVPDAIAPLEPLITRLSTVPVLTSD